MCLTERPVVQNEKGHNQKQKCHHRSAKTHNNQHLNSQAASIVHTKRRDAIVLPEPLEEVAITESLAAKHVQNLLGGRIPALRQLSKPPKEEIKCKTTINHSKAACGVTLFGLTRGNSIVEIK